MASCWRLFRLSSPTTAKIGTSDAIPSCLRTRAGPSGATVDGEYMRVSRPIPGMRTRRRRGTILWRIAAVSSSSLMTTRRSVHRPATRSAARLLTPADVHAGRATEITAARAVTLDAAYAAHPERFVRRPPTPPEVPTAVWINPPTTKEAPPQ
jgi:hypothetical protein